MIGVPPFFLPMSDEHQLYLPESFLDLHRDRSRSRLKTPIGDVRERYELCEDLAQQLVPQAQQVHFDLGVDEASVLERIEAGLKAPDSGLTEPEAGWVTTRLAELLEWRRGD